MSQAAEHRKLNQTLDQFCPVDDAQRAAYDLGIHIASLCQAYPQFDQFIDMADQMTVILIYLDPVHTAAKAANSEAEGRVIALKQRAAR